MAVKAKLRGASRAPETAAHKPRGPTIALLPWGNVLEDFLELIGLSLETFCNEFTGSWMFGYADALERVGVRTVFICTSSRVAVVTRLTHVPSGATICLLPAPKIYRLIRRTMINPYGRTMNEMFGDIRGARVCWLPLFAAIKQVALYLTTPLLSLARELRREGCDAILCQEYEYPRFDICVLLGRVMRLPVFATFQGGDYQRSQIEQYFRPRALSACAGLIVAAEREIRRVQACYAVPPHKLRKIFNPVDLQTWRPMNRGMARAELGIPAGAKVVVWHGRISIHQKGLDVLLDAWQRLCAECRGRDLRLLLLGSGIDSAKLRWRLTRTPLRGVVWFDRFLNDRTSIRRCLAAGDVYVFSSRHEGFPVSVIEAMACGLPVVASEAQGIPDILAGGEASGGLVLPLENPAALAQALRRVLEDEAWSRELGRRARNRVEAGFSHQAIGRQLRDFVLPLARTGSLHGLDTRT